MAPLTSAQLTAVKEELREEAAPLVSWAEEQATIYDKERVFGEEDSGSGSDRDLLGSDSGSDGGESPEMMVAKKIDIPLALEMFWREVGGVCFADPDNDEVPHRAWLGEQGLPDEGASPIWVEGPRGYPNALSPSWEPCEDDQFYCIIKADCVIMDNLSGGNEDDIICTPDPPIDPTLRGFYQWNRVPITFFTYVRRTILEGGGFAGYVDNPRAKDFVKSLVAGLEVF